MGCFDLKAGYKNHGYNSGIDNRNAFQYDHAAPVDSSHSMMGLLSTELINKLNIGL